MGKNSILAILIGLLFLSALSAGALTTLYVVTLGKYRKLQAQVNTLNYKQNLARAVIDEAMRYSQRNPAIDPILQAGGLKAKPGQEAK